MYGESILIMVNKINLNNKIANLLLLLFFMIPTLTVLGPLFPDLIISVTVLFSVIISLYDTDKKLKNLIINDPFMIIYFLFFFYLLLNSLINFISAREFIQSEIINTGKILLLDGDKYSFENFKQYFSRSLFFFRFVLYPVSIIFLITKFNIIIHKKYLIIFLLTILFIIFDLIFQYFNGSDIFGYVAIERGQLAIGRLSGPFGDELIPGSFLSRYFFISLLFLFFVVKNKKALNYAASSFIILCLITILLTGERSASLLCAFGIFIFFLLFKELRVKVLLSLTIFLILSSIFIYNNPILKKRMILDTLFQVGIFVKKDNKIVPKDFDENISIYKRVLSVTESKFIDSHYGSHWETAYRIWKSNKFIGIGLKQFRYECSNKEYDDIMSFLKTIRCATHPHNTYFEILSEIGLIGFIVFLFLVLALFRKIFLINKFNKSIKIPLISVILILWPIIPTGSFFTNMTQIYFSFLITIIFMIEKNLFKDFNKHFKT